MRHLSTGDEFDDDEETTFLRRSPETCVKCPKTTTPLPIFQLSILLLSHISDPLTSQCIAPFLNQLVGELDIIGGDSRKVGYYVGLMDSLYFVAGAFMVLLWSRLSDFYGRKPVILTGLASLFISMICFGLSRTFWALAVSLCIASFFNGKTSVIKSTVGEITDASNIIQGFALMRVSSYVGVTVGPLIGGSLSRPHEYFPVVFGGEFWIKHPYFLPCATVASYSAVMFVLTALYLKETVHSKTESIALYDQQAGINVPFLSAEEPPNDAEPMLASHRQDFGQYPVPLRKLLVPHILLILANYMYLALLDISFSSLLPLFYATPIEYGGLGLSPSRIGTCLGSMGFAGGVFQIFFAAKAFRRWGPKLNFIAGMACFISNFALFPVMNALVRQWGLSFLVWLLVFSQLLTNLLVGVSYNCIFIYITAAAPNQRSLGALNGLGLTLSTVARAVGTATSTSLFAYSSEHNLMGGYAVYGILVTLSCLSLLLAIRLPEDPWSRCGGGSLLEISSEWEASSARRDC